MSRINVGKVSPVPKGNWGGANAAYEKLNMVNYNGVLYIAKQDIAANKNIAITNTNYWMQATNKWNIGTVETINDSTASASASISEGSNTNLINLIIPRGAFDTEIIDDTAGDNDTTHVWSADKTRKEDNVIKTGLAEATGCRIIDNWTLDKYIITSNSTADISDYRTSTAGYRVAIVPCSPGDKFTVSAKGGVTPRAWAFLDDAEGNTKNVLMRAKESTTVERLLLIAPEDAAYLVINDQKVSGLSYYDKVSYSGNAQIAEMAEFSKKNLFTVSALADKTSGVVVDHLRTGFRISYTGEAIWAGARFVFKLKADTNYTISFTPEDKNDIGSVGFFLAESSTPTFPSAFTATLYSGPYAGSGKVIYRFKTNSYGYIRLGFYANQGSSGNNVIDFKDVQLEEDKYSYYDPYNNIYDYGSYNSLPATDNLLNLNNIAKMYYNMTFERLANGFRISCENDSTYRYAVMYIKLKPDTTYTFTATIIHNMEQEFYGWIGYAESTDDGDTYPSINKTLYSGLYESNDLEKKFTTTTGYVAFRFFSNAGVAEPCDTTFLNLKLEEKNKNVIKDENLFDIHEVKKKSGANFAVTENGFKVYSEEAGTYRQANMYIRLKPETTYSFTATIINNITQDVYGWVGYCESTDEGETYPTSNYKVIFSNNTEQTNQTKKTFTTTTGYVLITFFANGGTSEACDTSFVDLNLVEGSDIFDLPENIKAKAEIATMKLYRPGTTMGYPVNNPCNLLFFTDVHANENRAKRIKRLVNTWGTKYFDAVVFGGDMPTNIIQDNVDWYYDAFDGLSVPLLNVVGNHDTYWTNSGGVVEYADKSVTYGKIIAPIVESSEIVQPEGAAENYDGYYYKDINNIVRIIAIDGVRWNATQKSWLHDILADALSNELHVICVNHVPFQLTYMTEVDCAWMKHPWRISPLYYNNIQMAEEVQTFITNGGTFVCWLHGHTHFDNVHYMPNYGNQFCVTMAGSCTQQSHMMLNGDPENYTYDLMTYITVDTADQLIKFYRIGCGQELYGSIYKGLVIDYGNKRLYTSW